MSAHHKLTLVIQAGGESRRMGEDKALKDFLGEPLVQRVVRRLKPLGQETILIAREPAEYAFLGLPVHTDVQPGAGALGGLLTAMSVVETPFVAIIACDMPFVNPELLIYQWSLIQEMGIDVVIPIYNDELQPFQAIYRVKTCSTAIREALGRGRQKMLGWLDEVVTYRISPAEMRTFDAFSMAFLDLDTPDDFRFAEKVARNYHE